MKSSNSIIEVMKRGDENWVTIRDRLFLANEYVINSLDTNA